MRWLIGFNASGGPVLGLVVGFATGNLLTCLVIGTALGIGGSLILILLWTFRRQDVEKAGYVW